MCLLRPAMIGALLTFSAWLPAGVAQSPTDSAADEPARQTSVGVPLKLLGVVIPGPQLEPRPVSDESPVVVRLMEVYPHGSDFRYDLEVRGLEPGRYHLLDYLQTAAGEPAPAGQVLWLNVIPLLPDEQREPNRLQVGEAPAFGGYRLWARVAIVLWIVGLAEILRRIFFKRTKSATAKSEPLTLAAEMQQLIERILAADQLPKSDLARLENLLLAFWRERLGWENLDAHQAIQRLHAHPEAGQVLRQVEDWLHRPEPVSKVDWNALLEPYRHAAEGPAFRLEEDRG